MLLYKGSTMTAQLHAGCIDSDVLLSSDAFRPLRASAKSATLDKPKTFALKLPRSEV